MAEIDDSRLFGLVIFFCASSFFHFHTLGAFIILNLAKNWFWGKNIPMFSAFLLKIGLFMMKNVFN